MYHMVVLIDKHIARRIYNERDVSCILSMMLFVFLGKK